MVPRVKKSSRTDYVQLTDSDQTGVKLGYVPGKEDPSYAVLDTGLWQCLDHHGRVQEEKVKYVPDYVALLERDGSVYFIQRGLHGPIKIGWSQDVERRITELQVANAEKLYVIGAIPGTMLEERETHQRFSHLRMEAEWFRSSEEIFAFLRNSGGARPI